MAASDRCQTQYQMCVLTNVTSEWWHALTNVTFSWWCQDRRSCVTCLQHSDMFCLVSFSFFCAHLKLPWLFLGTDLWVCSRVTSKHLEIKGILTLEGFWSLSVLSVRVLHYATRNFVVFITRHSLSNVFRFFLFIPRKLQIWNVNAVSHTCDTQTANQCFCFCLGVDKYES